MASPLRSWRYEHDLSRKDLSLVTGLSEYYISQIEAGKDGIPHELQSYLTRQPDVNASEMVIRQLVFIVARNDRKSA